MEDPGRYAYSPSISRPKLELPHGARVAVWVVPNIEHYELLPAPNATRNPWPRVPHPDVLNYAIRDYGNRIGVWRLFEIMDEHDFRGTVSLNVAVCDHFPDIIEECNMRDWDYLGHGIYNTQYVYGMTEEQERAMIQDSIDTVKRATGKDLAGWLSPALTNSLATLDLIAEAGIKYTCDWFQDDQPFPLKVRKGRLISVPYSLELNDVIVYGDGHSGEYYGQIIKDHFDVLYAEGAESARVMCIPLHPYLVSHPHRLAPFADALDYICAHGGVWKATGEEIADWYLQSHYDTMVKQTS
ncbi:MAG: polysaccharide deacetylase family protein [Chloroflexi bacterium]|nr:polysaccharide deacetylase family protein [Chloroflexota bacterium]